MIIVGCDEKSVLMQINGQRRRKRTLFFGEQAVRGSVR
jgi:hypothetical protein